MSFSCVVEGTFDMFQYMKTSTYLEEYAKSKGYELETLISLMITHNIIPYYQFKINELHQVITGPTSISVLEKYLNSNNILFEYTYETIEPPDSDVKYSYDLKCPISKLLLTDENVSFLNKTFPHNDSYTWIIFNNEELNLSKKQGELLKIVHDSFLSGVKALTKEEVVRASSLPNTSKFNDTFRDVTLRQKLFTESSHKNISLNF